MGLESGAGARSGGDPAGLGWGFGCSGKTLEGLKQGGDMNALE